MSRTPDQIGGPSAPRRRRSLDAWLRATAASIVASMGAFGRASIWEYPDPEPRP